MRTTRPTLDKITVWRGEQIARSENRSLAAAIAKLVHEAWDARMASHEATLTPVVPGDRERAAGTLAAHMPAGRIAAIEAVAKIEHRTVSAMINLLVDEALKFRAANAAPAA